jgi:hypothetical protein
MSSISLHHVPVEVLGDVVNENADMESESDVVGSDIVPRIASETGNDYLENDDGKNVDDDIEKTKNPSGTANTFVLQYNRSLQ